MIVQIYETQHASEARALEAVGVDHIGVLVGQGRYARELRPLQARRIFQAITQARRVALSLADDLEEVSEVVAQTVPDILHLGTVPEALGPEAVVALKTRFPDLQLMRTIPVIDEQSLLLAQQYDGLVDYLLLDTYQPGETQVGATGAPHDWDLSRRIVRSVHTPVILAGGLGPQNVADGPSVGQPPIDAAAPGVPGIGIRGTGRVPQRRPAELRGQGASSATSSQAHVSRRRSPVVQGEDDRGKSQVCKQLRVFGTDRGAEGHPGGLQGAIPPYLRKEAYACCDLSSRVACQHADDGDGVWGLDRCG
jgi:phosphoribosylanthranilate isomerase